MLGFASACSAEHTLMTDPSNARYELREWPKGSVAVSVEDARPQPMGDSGQLTGLVETIVSRALATAQRPGGTPEQLKIAIRDHEVSLKERRWNGHTHLRAELTRGGRLLASWEAIGEDQRWDQRQGLLPSFADAEDSLQRAFARALDSLMRQLARRPSGS
jgi:hypothetical protein